MRAYRVVDGLYSDYSDTANAKTSGCLPPPAPTSLNASAASSSQINLTWNDNSSDETDFRIERSPDGNSNWTEIDTSAANTPSYSNTGLSACTTFYYRVRAYRSDDGTYSGYSNTANAKTTGCITIPNPPSGVDASDGNFSDKVQVSWNASSGATYYKVYRNTSDTSSGSSLLDSPTASPYDDTTAFPATTYYYFVKACNSAGCSAYSTSDSGYIPSVFVDDVYTTDENGLNSSMKQFGPIVVHPADIIGPMALKTTFNPGDSIRLYADIDNQLSSPQTIYYEWIVLDPDGQHVASLEDSGYLETAPDHVYWYVPGTIPTDALFGTYTFTVRCTYNDNVTYDTTTFYVSGSRIFLPAILR